MELKPQEISIDLLLEKYAKNEEQTIDDIHHRVALGLSEAEEDQELWYGRFKDALTRGFIPAGRIMSALGTDLQATCINCFVQPVGDSIAGIDEDGNPGIYVALLESAETMRRGGGVGYDFSLIRPRYALVKKTASAASGPVSYMHVFDRSCSTVESAGSRRGAQMAVLRCDHPDILEFVHAKDKKGDLENFNLSIGVTEEFMQAVADNKEWKLIHSAQPSDEVIQNGAWLDSKTEKWVYRTVKAADLYHEIITSTYDHAEPGILYLDRMNTENNLWYAEEIRACNPCSEQSLPNYGCCDLGSLNLTKFVKDPFVVESAFDFAGLNNLVKVAIRALDNVLDLTYWPLEQQGDEAISKRRVGLGFTGLGDALIMLGIRYDSIEARSFASKVSETMRDAAYWASVELSKEKGAFPLFDADKYLDGMFIRRLPADLRQAIHQHGIRNSHVLSIAPTGTVSLVFADNTSSGIEPAYDWEYERKKRMSDGNQKTYQVVDHVYRLYLSLGGDADNLPDSFVSALEIPVTDHMGMLEAVQPYIDSSISKTVNVPTNYPFDEFSDLYMKGWKAGIKGLATFRPNSVTGSILSTSSENKAQVEDLDYSDPDRRIRVDEVPEVALQSLRWQSRPTVIGGNPSWTYMVEHPYAGQFAVFIGHIENGYPHPFEVWINGAEQPRGLGALAKSLSMDMRSEDRGWLKTKLESLSKVVDAPFDMIMPDGTKKHLPGTVAAMAQLVMHRARELGVFEENGETPLLNALLSRKEPKTGPDGTLSWTVDVYNPNTGDDFVIGLKELTLPDGSRRPYSLWMSGTYPKFFDGLCKTLSFDCRVIDPAWIGKKLRQLVDYAEPLGDFMARVPGEKRQTTYPSTVAYVAVLIMHRYQMLSILDDEGLPVEDLGTLLLDLEPGSNIVPISQEIKQASVGAMEVIPGKRCDDCGSYSMVPRDGCMFCTSCGALGSCG